MGWKKKTAIGVTTAVVLAGAGAAAWADYAYTSNVAVIDRTWTAPTPTHTDEGAVPTPSTAPATPSPTYSTPTPSATTPSPSLRSTDKSSMTVLLIGSDSRESAADAAIGGWQESGARSDTQMLIHLYEGWNEAAIVSIPRDTMVKVPASTACPSLGWTRINEAYSAGGPACSAQTIADLTSVPIDHVVSVDFAGAAAAVDAIGGLDVCLTAAVADKDAHVLLSPGRQTLTGAQALGLLRARKSIGDGSDLDRTARQRYLVSQMVDQVAARATEHPASVAGLLSAAFDSVTVDTALTPSLSAQLLRTAAAHPPAVSTAMLPVVPDPDNPANTVIVDTTAAENLFAGWGQPTPPSPSAREPSPSATAAPDAATPAPSSSTTDSAVPYPFCP